MFRVDILFHSKKNESSLPSVRAGRFGTDTSKGAPLTVQLSPISSMPNRVILRLRCPHRITISGLLSRQKGVQGRHHSRVTSPSQPDRFRDKCRESHSVPPSLNPLLVHELLKSRLLSTPGEGAQSRRLAPGAVKPRNATVCTIDRPFHLEKLLRLA